MNAKVVALLLIAITLTDVTCQQTAKDTLNALLIEPFCQRVTVRSIMNVCATIIPDKSRNTFCQDSLTTSIASGSVEMSADSNSNRWCSFNVVSLTDPSAVITVNCRITMSSNSDPNDSLKVYPLDQYDYFTYNNIVDKDQKTFAYEFTGGVTLIANGKSPVSCSWTRKD